MGNFFKKPHYILVSAVVLLVLVVFSQFGVIAIETPAENTSEKVKLIIKHSQSGKTQEFESGGKVTKLMKRGDYEVLAKKDNSSSLALVKVRGFLQKTSISQRLAQEHQKQFVGNNPGPCVYFEKVLYSFECGDDFNNINRHIPATKELPTYISGGQKTSVFGKVLAIERVGGQTISLVHLRNPETGKASYFAYLFSSSLKPVGKVSLNELDGHSTYELKAFGRGYVIYKNDLSQINYYRDIRSKPEAIKIDQPKNQKLKAQKVFISDDKLILVYSDTTADTDLDKPSGINTNEVVVWSRQATKRFEINNRYIFGASVCADDKFCLVSAKSFYEYDISGSKPKQLIEWAGAIDLARIGNKTLVVGNDSIYSVDASTLTGFISYELNGRQYCGLRTNGNQYVVCVIDSAGAKSAILIDITKASTEDIDQKIQELKKHSAVIKSVSIYKHYIHITPDYGEPVYIKSLGNYGFSASTKQHINRQINDLLEKIGIDKKRYFVEILG